MKNIVIIGGSKGIGNAILLQQLESISGQVFEMDYCIVT